MWLFSLFFTAVFAVFWVSFPQNRPVSFFSVAVACLSGVVLALIRYVAIVEPRVYGYGWSLFVVVLSFHILPPIALFSAAFYLFGRLGVIPPDGGGWASWLLFALVPYGVIFALVPPEPGTLKASVLLPCLWGMIIVGMYFFSIRGKTVGAVHIARRILLVACILALPFFGAAAYFAWFAKETLLSAVFVLPLIVVTVLHFLLDYRIDNK